MKKQLLEQKKKAQFFFSLCLIFFCVTLGWSQTVFYEGFGPAPVSPFDAGATSYTFASNGVISTMDDANANTYLNFNSDGTAGRPNLTAPFSALTPSSFNTTLTNNTNLVTWSVNMRVSRAMSSSSQSYADASYYLAVVLCASNANLTAGTGSNTDGYALILQRSLPTSASNPGGVRLVKFHNGIGSSVGGSVVSPALLATPALNGGATATATAPNNVSIKVVYNPDFDSWQLFYREDPLSGGFADPTTGSYTSAGTAVVDATYTATAMTHFGYLAGLSTSTATATNQFQLDNFNFSLDPLPAFTPPPTVEKKQAINNSPAPTVANLVAIGADLKWYAAATGGSALLSTDPITSGTYYVTQTLAGTESDRVASSIYVGDTSLKTLPLYENFNYSVGDKLITINNDTASGTGIGSWSVVPTILPAVLSPDDMLIAAQPGTWTSSVLPVPTGSALIFDRSGLDPQLLFTAPTTGAVYASCLFMVTNLNAITAGTSGTSTDVPPAPGQIFSFAYADAPAGSNTSYTAAVYLKSSATAGKFNIGINAAPVDPIAVGDIVWDTADYDINTPITLVTRYSYDDLISKLWINPATTTEPAANATTLARTAALAVDRVRLNQSSNATTPYITLDEIRVANNFSYVTGGPDLKVAKMDVSKFSVYPNPVANGKLYISSDNSSEKQVAIYSILGQKVLDVKTSNNTEINVSKLAKGAYILNISEGGKSESKKLIIQ